MTAQTPDDRPEAAQPQENGALPLLSPSDVRLLTSELVAVRRLVDSIMQKLGVPYAPEWSDQGQAEPPAS